MQPRVSAAVWHAARPGRRTSAPVERIERRGFLSPSLGFYHTEFGEVVGELAAFQCRHDRHAVMATPRCSKLMSAATPSQRRVRLEVGGCGSSRSTPTRQLHRQLSRAAFRSPRRQSDAATLSVHSGFRININPCRLDYHRDSASVHICFLLSKSIPYFVASGSLQGMAPCGARWASVEMSRSIAARVFTERV